MMNKSSAATAIHTPAGCRPTKRLPFCFLGGLFAALRCSLRLSAPFCAAFPCRLCILPLDLLLLHEAGKGIARNLRIVMQGFVVLEIHIRLERRFLCLCRRPVGFELVAAVALLDFPRPVLCAALCQFFGFVRPLTPELSFSTECILLWTKIPASCAGRDSGLLWGLFLPMGFSCSSKCRRVLPFPVASSKVRSRTSFFSLGIAAFAASRRSAALSVFSDIPFKLRRCPFLVGKLQAGRFFFCCGFCLCFPRRLFARLSGTRPVDTLQDALGCGGVLFPFCPRRMGKRRRGGCGRGSCAARYGLRCLFRRLRCFGLCKVRVPYPLADTFLFPGGGVYLDSPLAGHFLRDFLTRSILFYFSVPPIRALARAQYSAFISMPI